jgi:uncharacterized protein involved in response to NO
MIVKINGQPLEMVYPSSPDVEIEPLSKKDRKKLKQMAITLWTLSGTMLTRNSYAASSTSFYEQMQPLNWLAQDMVLGFGVLAIIIGLVLFAVKKRWGTKTLKITGLVIAGVFLAPSVVMLFAIIGTLTNDALYNAFENIRQSIDAKAVYKP